MVVDFHAWEDGELIEVAHDWYAQDMDGNVWYFGEDVENYKNGQLINMDGSWEAGVEGAVPGIIMKAHPQAGDSLSREYYRGEAEDQSRILSTTASVSTEYGEFQNCVKTTDGTDLEPCAVEHKYYAEGVGIVYEITVQRGSGSVELVEIRHE